jgi:gluconate 2-dehydrogenase gamma chain
MTRRELIQKTSLALGYGLSAPTLMGILEGCQPKHELSFQPNFFSEEQGIIVGDLAENILPRTTTPGAKDVGVPAFIDNFVREVYPKEEQDKFITGLLAFNQGTISRYFMTFIDCTPDLQRLYVIDANLNALKETTRVSEGWWNNSRTDRPFILTMKELTILGYFTSQIGASEVLQYNPAPGPYQGCVPLATVGKAWAT